MKFNFLNGTDGEQSSKRLFAFILVVLWAVYFISNLYWGFALKGSLEEYSFYLINASFFSVIAERFSGKKVTETKVDVTQTEIKKTE